MTNLANESPFWQFSCAVYSRPEIAAHLLVLQNQYDFNIPIILFMFWLGQQNRLVNDNEVRVYLNLIADTDTHFIKPLRKLRQSAKETTTLPTSCYEQFKTLELSLEHHIFLLLFNSLYPDISPTEKQACIRQNLQTYFFLLNKNLPVHFVDDLYFLFLRFE